MIQIAALTVILGSASCVEANKGGGDQAQTVATQRSLDLPPVEFRKAMGEAGVQLIDVRTPGEVAQGRIANSKNIDWMSPDHEFAFDELDPNSPILLYCQAGGRSRQALEFLQGKGFKDVRHLDGGFGEWQSAGFPVER